MSETGVLKRCAATMCLCLVVSRGAVAQQMPTVVVELRPGGEAPVAAVSLRGLLDDSRFLNAMRSGFPLYLEYQVELREAKSNWFDPVVAEYSLEYVIHYHPVREIFVLEEAAGIEELRTESALRRRLETVYLVDLSPEGPGHFYYQATITARTLSDADVDEVFEWLRGEDDSTGVRRPGFITRGARRLLVQIAPLPRMRESSRTRAFNWQ